MLIPHNHSPNGGRRSITEGVKFKRMGTKAGYPDIEIFFPCGIYHGLYIEFKEKEKGKISKIQNYMLDYMKRRGYSTNVCYDHQAAIDTTKAYLGDQYQSFVNRDPDVVFQLPSN